MEVLGILPYQVQLLCRVFLPMTPAAPENPASRNQVADSYVDLPAGLPIQEIQGMMRSHVLCLSDWLLMCVLAKQLCSFSFTRTMKFAPLLTPAMFSVGGDC